jgi:hypothetical protein
MRRRCVRVVSALGVTLLAVAAISAVPVQLASAQAAASTLDKSAQNLTHPGANPVSHGDTVNWVLDYNGTGPAGPSPATITDPIVGAGAAQSYVPGSLTAPPGWTRRWSTDGTTFQTTDPGAGTVAVRADNPAARPGGTSVDSPLLPPVQSAPVSTGGDGYSPILHRTAAGGVESWNMYHHLAAAAPKLVCTDLIANTLCAGGPWPKPVNTAPGPFGAGNTGDIASPLIAQYVEDPADSGVIYYSGVTATSVGVGCLDLDARANCGFWPLGAVGAINGIGGLVAIGGNLYGVGTSGHVLCLTMASHTPCAGQPYAPVVPAYNNVAGGYVYGATAVAGGKLFASVSSPSGGTPVLGCFDPTTGAACAGWAAPKPTAPSGYTYTGFTAYDTAGNAAGACATVVTGGPPSTTCYTVAGAPLAAPAALGALPNGELVFNPEVVTTANGHVRSYFGSWGATVGVTTCHDWTTAAPCAGFPSPAAHPGLGSTRDYGYAYDEVTDCLIGLGDAGVLFSIDPAVGTSPCIHSGATAALNPAAFYCDGGTGHVRGYRDARLENIDIANVNLAASTVDVSDTGGGPIATPGLAPDGTVDLSGISAVAHPDITVSVQLVLDNGSDFTGPDRPTMVLSFDGDAPQVCFRTTVATACTATAVTNTATGTDATGPLTSNTVDLAVAPGPACQPNVTVNKEICTANDAHNCIAGGSGPWAKQAPVGILGLLYAHPYWRITITNAGPVGITGAQLIDAAEPTCVTAAGTFTLAPGASKQVYCDTSTLLALLPMTNTASARYTPANSPAGTPPTTTASSSARACPLLCILG